MVLLNMIWATFLSLLSQQNPTINRMLVQVSGSTTAVSLLTAPLALLLTLRANNSLSRLGDARALWGKMVLHSRTLSGLLRVYTFQHAPIVTMAAARHMALLGWSVKAFVRGESISSERDTFQTLLDDATVDWLIRGDETPKHTVNHSMAYSSLFHQPPSRIALTGRLRQLCATAIQETEKATGKQLHTPQLLMEEQIARLEHVVGGCERLHGSPTIPPTYSRHLSRVISMFLFFMPIGLVSSAMSLVNTVLISAVASYVFVGIDEVGMEVENAFSLVPLQQLSSAVHVGVRDQLVCLNDAPPII
jgi:predicted membrane chloride channel (bestrophin family)